VFRGLGRIIGDFAFRTKQQFGEVFDYIASWGDNPIENQFAGFLDGMGDVIRDEVDNLKSDPIDLEGIMTTDWIGAIGERLGTMVENFRAEVGTITPPTMPETPDVTPVTAPDQSAGTVAPATSGFMEGIQNAMTVFRDQVTDTAAYGTRIFNTMAQGWSDAILNFAETGKLSFKDLFRSLMAEIIKMQANRLFMAIMGGGSAFGGTGGGLSSLFAGLFANGGTIPGGKFGIVGEAGPEFVRGPATVTSARQTAHMMSQAPQQVTYNINATDARSFQQLLASDPGLIHSLAQRGARGLPR
jgi:hypothetical protein